MRSLLALALTTIILAACGSTAVKPEPLEKLQWKIAGDESARPMTLQFDVKEKRASGFAGCNNYGGTYTLDHNQLSFGPLMSTKMACAENARNQTEQQFLEALSHVDSYVFERDALTLYDENAAQLLRFHAMPADARAHDAR